MSEFIKEIIATILMFISLGGWSFIISRLAYISGKAKGFREGYDEPRKTIDELERIKAEFEEIKGPRDNPYNNKTEYSVSMKELREVFDKHISELKGENND